MASLVENQYTSVPSSMSVVQSTDSPTGIFVSRKYAAAITVR